MCAHNSSFNCRRHWPPRHEPKLPKAILYRRQQQPIIESATRYVAILFVKWKGYLLMSSLTHNTVFGGIAMATRISPTPSWDLVGERDGRDLRWSPRQQRGEPRPMSGAMDFGIADHSQGACREQTAQITIASFTSCCVEASSTSKPRTPARARTAKHFVWSGLR